MKKCRLVMRVFFLGGGENGVRVGVDLGGKILQVIWLIGGKRCKSRRVMRGGGGGKTTQE